MVLPTLTSIVLVQNLYDALFQYVLTKEQEEKLEGFIKTLEAHIKKKSRAPFSMPLDQIEFLGEGLQELRLLNWMEIPVLKFAINWQGETQPEDTENALQEALAVFQDYFIFDRSPGSQVVYAYPYRITAY